MTQTVPDLMAGNTWRLGDTVLNDSYDPLYSGDLGLYFTKNQSWYLVTDVTFETSSFITFSLWFWFEEVDPFLVELEKTYIFKRVDTDLNSPGVIDVYFQRVSTAEKICVDILGTTFTCLDFSTYDATYF